jgi:cbb3-type cytochrome oxidase subunit 1
MNGHVWRVPALLGVMALGGLLLFAAGVVASTMARHRSSTVRKLAIAGTLVLLAVVTGIAIRTTVWAISRTLDINVTHVDPGLLGYLAPVLFATFVWMVGKRLLHDSWTSRSALLYYVWLLTFTALNTVNRCSPGWCTTIGFPFAWQSWSDAIFNNDRFRVFTDAIGAGLNLLTFVVVAILLTRVHVRGVQPDATYRRARARPSSRR